MNEIRCVRTLTERVVSSVMDNMRRKRPENSAGLFVKRSVFDISFSCSTAAKAFRTPCWKMFSSAHIRYQYDKQDVEIGGILAISRPKITMTCQYIRVKGGSYSDLSRI